MILKNGDIVSTLVRVLSDPPIERGTKCTVVGVSNDRQKVFLQGPNGQVASLPRGDVFPCRK